MRGRPNASFATCQGNGKRIGITVRVDGNFVGLDGYSKVGIRPRIVDNCLIPIIESDLIIVYKMMKNRIFIAPMMDWTDRHCRYFLRLLNKHVHLYTEMLTAQALVRGDGRRLLRFHPAEHPVALQLGGSDPALMAAAAREGSAAGYDEINMNVGCPSDRVQSGQFGACLMASPDRVADCVRAMRAATGIPVTVKTRIGIDDQDSYDFLLQFIETVADAGCTTFIVHARKAILEGLSPKDNRQVPPLHYERVYRLKREHPELTIVLNGGVTTTAQVLHHLEHVDGVMIGRQAYQDPWFLVELAHAVGSGERAAATRCAVVEEMRPYIEQELAAGTELKHIIRHMLGLFKGQPGARSWRRHLSENAHQPGAGIEVIDRALAEHPSTDATAPALYRTRACR
jgi:tRNA-dihydrouridine synthase A